MRAKLFISILLAAITFSSCDDTTEGIGVSIIDSMDNFNITTDTFTVKTRSITVDSVYSRNNVGYLGSIIDPETGLRTTGDCMIQFHTFEDYKFPDINTIISKDANGDVVSDSCELKFYYNSFYGDSLATMKMSVYEMLTPMSEGVQYYSSYDPQQEGLTRELPLVTKMYTLADLNVDLSTRSSTDYSPHIQINLDQPYKDRDGHEYNNFGTYIMRKYYENPEYFKNSYRFIHNVQPGVYLKSEGGIGSMAYIDISQLRVHFRYKENDSIYHGIASFDGTEEVLQTTRIANDKQALRSLAADNSCTYIKTPSAIFTEVELPVDDIMAGHEKDSLNAVKLSLKIINNQSADVYNLPVPKVLLIIPRDSLYSFFEHNNVANYKTSFIATYTTNVSAGTPDAYTFSNIAGIVSAMYKSDRSSEDWNKVVIVPVSVAYNSSSELTKVVHDMSLTSVRLVGGAANPYEPVKLSVIYSKFR